MKTIFKSTLATALLAGAAIAAPAVAAAGVDVSVNIGAPGLVYSPGPGYSPYEGQVYYDPIYFGGAWYHGPYRWRVVHGERVFWVDGGWHRNEWRGRPIPASLTFRNGGYFRSGRYEDFEGADRINTRFNMGRGMERGDRPDVQNDRGDMQDRRVGPQDRGDMRQPGSARQDRRGKPDPAQDDSRPNDSGPPHN